MLLMPLCVLALNDDNHPTYFVTHDGEKFNLCDFITKVVGPAHENDVIVRYFSIIDVAEGLNEEETDYAFELVSGLVSEKCPGDWDRAFRILFASGQEEWWH